MKRLFLTFAILGGLLLSSCSNVEEVCYSCDSEIDAWVKSNKTELNNMSREEYSKLDILKQKAAYVSFSPKRRKQFWDEKMNELLSEFSFTKEERDYLSYIELTIKNHTFGNNFSNEKSKEIMNWMKEGQNKFGWTDKFLYNAFFKVSTYSSKVLFSNNEEVSCNCIYNVFCWINGSRSCTKAICEKTSSGGCGALFELDCTGACG